MKIQTKWFGEIDTTEDKIITFEKGIIGFEDFKKFTIVVDAEKESENTIMWLQSAEEPSLALTISNPEIVKEDYDRKCISCRVCHNNSSIGPYKDDMQS